MATRLTDNAKWKNPWFRSLPGKAKLAWLYLCDECDFAGIWKADYELAGFQLGFNLNKKMLIELLGDKLHFFGTDQVLIIKFFEFQYSGVKETWTARVKAKQRLENLGFKVDGNQIVIDHSGTTVGGPSPDGLIDININIVNGIKGGVGEKLDFESAYKLYPLKKGKAKGIEKCQSQIKTQSDLDNLKQAIEKYKASITDPKYIEHFSTFMSHWREVLEPDYGTCSIKGKPQNWDEKKRQELNDRLDKLLPTDGEPNDAA